MCGSHGRLSQSWRLTKALRVAEQRSRGEAEVAERSPSRKGGTCEVPLSLALLVHPNEDKLDCLTALSDPTYNGHCFAPHHEMPLDPVNTRET